MINKKSLPDGRVIVSLFCDPDVANDLFLLAKQKNIEIAEESPVIDEKILQSLNKTAGKDIAIQKIEKMAEEINSKQTQQPAPKGLQEILRHLAKKEKQ